MQVASHYSIFQHPKLHFWKDSSYFICCFLLELFFFIIAYKLRANQQVSLNVHDHKFILNFRVAVNP